MEHLTSQLATQVTRSTSFSLLTACNEPSRSFNSAQSSAQLCLLFRSVVLSICFLQFGQMKTVLKQSEDSVMVSMVQSAVKSEFVFLEQQVWPCKVEL